MPRRGNTRQLLPSPPPPTAEPELQKPPHWVYLKVVLFAAFCIAALGGVLGYVLVSRNVHDFSGFGAWFSTRSYWSAPGTVVFSIICFLPLRSAVNAHNHAAKGLLTCFLFILSMAFLVPAFTGAIKFVLWWQLEGLNKNSCVYLSNSSVPTVSISSHPCQVSCDKLDLGVRTCCCCGDIRLSDDKTFVMRGVDRCLDAFDTTSISLVIWSAVDGLVSLLLIVATFICLAMHCGCCGPSLSRTLDYTMFHTSPEEEEHDAGSWLDGRQNPIYGSTEPYNHVTTFSTRRHQPSAPGDPNCDRQSSRPAPPPPYDLVV